MTELSIATAAPDKIVLAVVSHLNEGQIDDALALFADEFSFKDHGVGLEFNTKDRPGRIFQKGTRTLPGYVLAV